MDLSRDDTLAWATGRRACIIFNLHVEHTQAGIEKSGVAFRALIDLALERSGSFFLTYHRHATSQQLLSAYPRLPAFLKAKETHDSQGLFKGPGFKFATNGTPFTTSDEIRVLPCNPWRILQCPSATSLQLRDLATTRRSVSSVNSSDSFGTLVTKGPITQPRPNGMSRLKLTVSNCTRTPPSRASTRP